MKSSFPGRVSIIGAARSGIAAARFLIDRGVDVFVSDRCGREELEKILKENGLGTAGFEARKHTDRVLETELIVLSPGVRPDLPVLEKARDRKIPVWSELELGFRASRATFYAVTGSTGKSTTVSLAGAALAAAGMEHAVAGNIGIPVVSTAPGISEKGSIVAEVSSFQLESIDKFKPRAAVILNLMKNHLDRYDSEEEYYDAKKKIAGKLSHSEYLILNAADPRLVSWGKTMERRVRVVYFGANCSGNDSVWCEGSMLRYRLSARTGVVGDLKAMKLRGRHNYENAAVAAVLSKIAGAPDGDIYKGLCMFSGLPHRLEYVSTIDGVDFYNDSKSTTAESIACAVDAFPGGVHLIAGGKDKGCEFTLVNKFLQNSARSVILIGEAADRMQRQWEGTVKIDRKNTLTDAVTAARLRARPGEAVVFSPGCSSFDMFRNYEERGDLFRTIVLDLGARERKSE